MQKAAEARQREGIIIVHVVTESFGGWHEVAVEGVGTVGYFFLLGTAPSKKRLRFP